MTRRPFLVVGTAADTTVTIVRESVSVEREQGLVLDTDDALTVGEVEAPQLVLWAHTAPERVQVRTGAAGELRIWNVWRDADIVQAWVGRAGLVVDDEGDDLGVSCHDGHESDHPDLVVRVSFDRAWTQPDGER